MSSINYNAAATSALRSLQSTNMSLDATQGRISTGLKIGEAKDNAAYWSISTTLKSDNKALSTVNDALGLGSATVDVAYQSLNATKDVLDEIKSKLVAATQDGVDKAKIQSEIGELQKQLKAIASSATFSGENWLDVNSSDAGYDATKKVVSGYTRDATGLVTISTVDIDTSKMNLINRNSSGEGILDGGVAGNTGKGGLVAINQAGTGGAVATKASFVSASIDMTASTNAATNITAAGSTLTMQVKIDGTTIDLTGVALTDEVALTGATTNTAAEVAQAVVNRLNANAAFLALGVATVDSTDKIKIESKTAGTGGSAEIVNLSFGGTGAHAQTAIATGITPTAGTNAKLQLGTFSSDTLNLDVNDSVSFDLSVDGATATRVTINKNLITSVLPSSNGKVDNISDYKLVLGEALRVAGLPSVVVGGSSTNVTLTAGKSSIAITSPTASKGVDLTSFDMTNATSQQLASLVAAVNSASEQVTSAASTLGAVASRLELQKSFVNTLMDTIDKGVSGLVDADMNEESTKLQALQVKQSLGVQALSIANQSAQNVLRLFQ